MNETELELERLAAMQGATAIHPIAPDLAHKIFLNAPLDVLLAEGRAMERYLLTTSSTTMAAIVGELVSRLDKNQQG